MTSDKSLTFCLGGKSFHVSAETNLSCAVICYQLATNVAKHTNVDLIVQRL
jgi:hypothetical protein